jgi:hypothetical protein
MSKHLDVVVSKYRLAGNPWPARSIKIAEWAIAKDLWRPHPSAALKQCAREISRSMREEYYTDGKGRRVRLKHAVSRRVGAEQYVLWDDIRTAPRNHMELSFRQRRERIVGDCRQLSVDADSYNDSHPEQVRIQVVFNFVNDLLELEAEGAA